MTTMNRAQRRAASAKLRRNQKCDTDFEIPNDLLRAIYNSAPTMIHEDQYVALNCVLCNATMQSIHDTHDARPLAPSQTAKQALEQEVNIGRCCSQCNASSVKRARLADVNAIEIDNRKAH